MKSRLVAFLIALNITALAIHAPDLFTRASAAIEDWSTSAASNNSAAPNGFPEGMNPSDVNDAAREVMAQVRRLAQQAVMGTFGPDGGSANAYFITPALKPAAYVSGQVFHVVPSSTNTGAATLNVASLGTKTIKKMSNSDLASGDMQAGSLYTLVYNGTVFQLLNPKGIVESSGITTSMLAANAVTLSKIATATAGNLLVWDTTGAAAVITPGLAGQVLTSAGANAVPRMQTPVTASIVRGTVLALNPFSGNARYLSAHSLSGVPDYVDAGLINRTADCGYGVGDLIALPVGGPLTDSAAAGPYGINIVKGATGMTVVIANAANIYQVLDKVSFGNCGITNASWALLITPYKIN